MFRHILQLCDIGRQNIHFNKIFVVLFLISIPDILVKECSYVTFGAKCTQFKGLPSGILLKKV